MKRLCTFVSLEDSLGQVLSDDICRQHLEAQGWELQEWAWTQTHPWHRADAVVFRSCYDYWQRLPDFLSFLAHLESLGVPLFNCPRLLRWNLDKSYLFQLEQAGIPVVPARLVQSVADVKGALSAFVKAESLVLKPCIGAGGFEMIRFQPQQADDLVFQGKWLLQPYLPTIQDGEWSVIFFENEASHAVVKRARPGEYRVQDVHGGTTAPCQLSPALLKASENVLQALRYLGLPQPLYSRLDFVADPRDGSLLLMEVELVEPSLFFEHSTEGSKKFVDALLSRLRE